MFGKSGLSRTWKVRIFSCAKNFKLYISQSELQKVGILISRIPDISGRLSGHIQIVAANLTIFGMKCFKIVDL